MHIKRSLRHIAFWINVLVIRAASWQMVEQFNRANFNNPIPFAWLESGGFCIQNNFTHLFAFS